MEDVSRTHRRQKRWSYRSDGIILPTVPEETDEDNPERRCVESAPVSVCSSVVSSQASLVSRAATEPAGARLRRACRKRSKDEAAEAGGRHASSRRGGQEAFQDAVKGSPLCAGLRPGPSAASRRTSDPREALDTLAHEAAAGFKAEPPAALSSVLLAGLHPTPKMDAETVYSLMAAKTRSGGEKCGEECYSDGASSSTCTPSE